jgi:hypothetical protein
VLAQSIGNSDGIHNRTQHAHGIGMGPLHLISTVLDTPPEVTGTNHQTHLHTHIHTFLNGCADRIDNGKIQASMGESAAYTIERVFKTIVVIVLFALCTVRLAGDSYNPFIYFKF